MASVNSIRSAQFSRADSPARSSPDWRMAASPEMCGLISRSRVRFRVKSVLVSGSFSKPATFNNLTLEAHPSLLDGLLFLLEDRARPEGPIVNSHDRKVVEHKGQTRIRQARRADS